MSNQSGGGGGIGPCTQHEDGWLLSGPAAQRLFDKSAIGLPQPQNKLLLQSSEVIFCARHRHLEIDENWLVNQLNIFPELLHEAAALEALRVPGEKILLSQNVSEINPKIIFSQASWAVRWARSS
nr:hypothetical protein [Euryarchaeota archaeon]